MNLDALGEDALVSRLTAKLPTSKQVVVGPGDDCAVLRVKGTRKLQLLKTDCIVEGVHFLRNQRPTAIGWKAMARAISDIAACGGTPDAAVVTFAAPPDLPVATLDGIYRGLTRAAKQFDVSIVGGESAKSPTGIFLNVALTGWVKADHLVLRSGGRSGDFLWVTGRLGGSLSGHHLTFIPRLTEARWLAEHHKIHAMMDLSDGLGADLPRLARASRLGFEIDPDAIPRTRGCNIAQAIGDGEDYELLFSTSARSAKRLQESWRRKFPRTPLTCIGRLLADRSAGFESLQAGYSHFSTCGQVANTDTSQAKRE